MRAAAAAEKKEKAAKKRKEKTVPAKNGPSTAFMDPKLWGTLQSHVDLLENLYCRLPLESFFALRAVCKDWGPSSEMHVRDLDFGIEIIGRPLLREEDGLAKSSRNIWLSVAEWKDALSISRSLREVEDAVRLGEADATVLEQRVHKAITSAGGKVDYAKWTRRRF